MFTGIVEERGTVATHTRGLLGIRAPKVAREAALGDSICTNGVCLTVTRLDGDVFYVDYSDSTRDVTTVGNWRVGSLINLEQAVTLNTRLGGHLVAGHVDGVGRILTMREQEGMHITLALPGALRRYVIDKGSIAVDGVSLTIVANRDDQIDLTIIPHTWRNTALQDRRPGDTVNLEVDVLAKYVERLLKGDTDKQPGLTFESLARMGF